MSTPDTSLKQSLSEAYSEFGCPAVTESACPRRARDGRFVIALWLEDAHVGRVEGRVSLYGTATVPAICRDVPSVGDYVHVAYQHYDDRQAPPSLRAQASPDLWRVVDSAPDEDGNTRVRILVTGTDHASA